MTIQTLVTASGEKLVVLPLEEYEDLVDGRAHAAAMAGIEAGDIETFSSEEAARYLASPSPVGFWRRHRGFTAASLAAEAGLSEDQLCDVEARSGEADVRTYARLASALRVRIEDLIEAE